MTNDIKFNIANTLSNISQNVIGRKVYNRNKNAANRRNGALPEVVSSEGLASEE